ncbi:MAG: serine/threonine protein kinase, partial [Myxococcota bacterium]
MSRAIPFGKYLLIERINVGGMAEVFKAKPAGTRGLEQLVAIKRILPAVAQDPAFVRMFVEEARTAQRLAHPNIVRILELGRVGHSVFLAMEYVRGKDLRAIAHRMREQGKRVPVPLACHVVMKACEGLHHAHEQRDADGRRLGLVHRDVSPQNVLVSIAGEVKLIDFGIAKAANKAAKAGTGVLEGKFAYMSPEQVRGLPLDRRSDVFSAGIVLYELLTGERLFVGASDFSILEKVRNAEIEPPSRVTSSVPPELERIVLRALARDPDERFQTAADLQEALESFLYSSGTFFGARDLSAWVGEVFSRDIEAERIREEQYRLLEEEMADDSDKLGGPDTERHPVVPEQGAPAPGNKPPGRKKTMVGLGAPPPAPPAAASAQGGGGASGGGSGGLSDWDDDDMATQVYDKAQHGTATPSEPPPSPAAPSSK